MRTQPVAKHQLLGCKPRTLGHNVQMGAGGILATLKVDAVWQTVFSAIGEAKAADSPNHCHMGCTAPRNYRAALARDCGLLIGHFEQALISHYCQHVDYRLGGQTGNTGAADVMNLQKQTRAGALQAALFGREHGGPLRVVVDQENRVRHGPCIAGGCGDAGLYNGPMADPAVKAVNLRKNYGDFVAVDGIDFEIQRGECFGFLGPNGAGKTTTMRMIYRASPVGSGSLMILGHEAAQGHRDRAIKGRIGVVPQEDNLDTELTLRENLQVFARFYGLSKSQAATRTHELLEFVQLREKADAKAFQLSGGMKRRALIARGLLGDPELLVLDEPTTGLDPQARINLWERLRDLKRKNATLILTTHYMDEAEQLCDRLVIMDKGKIVAQGAPKALIREHVSSHVVEVAVSAQSGSDGVVTTVSELTAMAKRHEQHHDRLLLYVDNGEEVVTRAAQLLPDAETLLRRSTLEDVFLKITGRGLVE